jgi:hypothetical protein
MGIRSNRQNEFKIAGKSRKFSKRTVKRQKELQNVRKNFKTPGRTSKSANKALILGQRITICFTTNDKGERPAAHDSEQPSRPRTNRQRKCRLRAATG